MEMIMDGSDFSELNLKGTKSEVKILFYLLGASLVKRSYRFYIISLISVFGKLTAID